MPKRSKKSRPDRNGKEVALHVALLIDESGSMMGNEPAVIGGVNEFIQSLRKQEADTKVKTTLAMFDLHGEDEVLRVKCSAVPLEEVTLLAHGDYSPRGSTPLNDAVGGTIRRVQRQARRGDRVIIVVLTDGLENASETSTEDLRKVIRGREKKGWEFIYLGANQDAWAESQKIGVTAPGRAFQWDASPAGTADALSVAADRVQSFRDDPARYEDEAEELERRRPR